MNECVECRGLLIGSPGPQSFVLAPADGGGWDEWNRALLRLVERIGDGPTHAVVITQDSMTQRYVQALVGHGLADVQASSNIYLTGPSSLGAAHEQMLTVLGWQPPERQEDDPEQMPANWWVPRIHGDWVSMVSLLSATLIGIFGFDEHAPVMVRTFLCDEPCRHCSWPDDPVLDRDDTGGSG